MVLEVKKSLNPGNPCIIVQYQHLCLAIRNFVVKTSRSEILTLGEHTIIVTDKTKCQKYKNKTS